jgi:hypothetical protein
MECLHCKKVFSTKGILNTHQKSAKYCIALQRAAHENTISYPCEYCNKTYTQMNSLDRHISKCISKIILEKDIFIEKQKQELLSKDQKLKEIIDKHNYEIFLKNKQVKEDFFLKINK